MKYIVKLLLAVWLMFGLQVNAAEHQSIDASSEEIGQLDGEYSAEDDELSLDEDSFGFEEEDTQPDLWRDWFGKPARITLKHEGSYKVKSPTRLVNNRSSVRLEYDKYFLEDFFIRFDGKLNGYWGGDHQTGARDHKVLVKEAFIQGSFGNTSIKLGRQMLIWGESEGGAITDVVAPRNLSELFYINLEESRLGQNMVNIDHFSQYGDFSAFFVPDAKFNHYPEEGSAYYIDPFGGMGKFGDIELDKSHEYGVRYKKTIGKSDVALMAARLVDNDFITTADQTERFGVTYFGRTAGRISMAGATFNYAMGNFLLSGEVAGKKDKLFNDSTSNIYEKDVLDTAIALEYSINGNDLMGIEVVNSHIDSWDKSIEFAPRNSYSIIFNYLGFFANEDFMVNWLSILSEPYTSTLHNVYTSYKFDDNLSMDVNFHFLFANDKRSVLYTYRDERQLAVKLKYQF